MKGGHLIDSVCGMPLREAREALVAAHEFIATRSHASLSAVPAVDREWGSRMKRITVDLLSSDRPSLIHKESERLVECVNMLATVERLVAALSWFEAQPDMSANTVDACHPSTSGGNGSNDLVLVDGNGQVRVRCEVCDVVSTSAGQNGKERKDLKSLGCESEVPADDVRRFLIVSSNWAPVLQAQRRNWGKCSHRYVEHLTTDVATVLLEVVQAPRVTAI